MTQLPILESCEGCGGACCSEMSAPGGYITLLKHPEWQSTSDADSLRLQQMPDEARRELEDYLKQGQERGFPFRTPCFWLLADGTCKWYDWRPTECREFERNSWTCHHWRRERGVEPPNSPSVLHHPT